MQMTRGNSSAFEPTTMGAWRLRRGLVLLACVFVLGWTLLSATHWHGSRDAASRGEGAACALCLAMPTGAAPPQQHVLHAPPPVAVWARALPAPPAPATGSASAYQSRAPPAA
jgi:hypothetical protein